MSSKSSHAAMEAHVRSNRTSASGCATRHGSRSSSICEKVLKEDSLASPRHLLVENRVHGRPPKQHPSESRLERQDKSPILVPLT